MPDLLRKIGRSRLIKLADGRKQVIDRFEVRSDAGDPANLSTVFLAWGTAHPKYTDCLLIQQPSLDFSGDQRVEQDLVRVYEELHATNETQVGKARRLLNAENLAYYEADFIQFSDAAQVDADAVIGVLACPDVANTLCVYESTVDDGTLRRITRRYQVTASTGAGPFSYVEVGGLKVERPLAPAEPTAVIITRKLRQIRNDYEYPAENDLCPYNPYDATPECYFCEDSPLVDVGGDVIEWTRTWANVPASYNDFDTMAVVYPGIYGLPEARLPDPSTTSCLVTYDFFLVGTGAPDYTTAGEIPVFDEARVDFTSGISYGLLSGSNFFLNDVTGTPSKTDYLGYVSNDEANPEDYSIEAAPSRLSRYKGNIWRRIRIFVKAK